MENKDKKENQIKCSVLNTTSKIEQIMSWIKNFTNMRSLINFVVKCLSIAQLPISECKEKYWCIEKHYKSSLVYFVVKKWWFPVKICKEISFANIKV